MKTTHHLYGDLVELLATTEPGVVDTKAGAHFTPHEIKTIISRAGMVTAQLSKECRCAHRECL